MVPRRLLLVGEGNFSFAASLIDTLEPGVRVTATCLQHRADLQGDPVALENLRRLRERGIEVRFAVDCTQLAQALQAHGDFDRIYFNFPHCGRKAGVARNRALLAKFFQSCADVLAKDGEVHVALCRGQGGTPADKPQREWHNSWQVVAMAALGGFILSDVHPFRCGAVPGYKCTGYRRFLEAPSCHPVRTINEKLIAELGKTFPLKRLKCLFPLLPRGGASVLPPGTNDLLSAFWVSLHEDSPHSEALSGEITQEMEEVLVSVSERTFAKSPAGDGCSGAHEGICEEATLCLRSSLLVHGEAILHSPDFLPGSLHILSGPVFRKCHISPFMMPAFHETLFLLGLNKNMEENCLSSLLDHLKGILDNLLTETLLEGSIVSTLVEFVLQPNGKDYIIHVKPLSFGPDCTENLIIGSVVTSATVTHEHQCFVFVSINLDLLAMLAYDISDWRILWTFDGRFLRRFAPGKIERFKSYSLYPPHYVHDISFWLDEKKGFNELEFHTIARAVSQDTIISVQFLGRFQHPETEQVSLCYRLIYQTCDKALSLKLAAAMQSRLREEIQRQLHVLLR
ncbi:ferredoxin-fold anticodon-binding domain-containing protein 1 isoform X2 [Meriones unguiculatus]|uniref:ferredoxin-fold anticodon-binding domain-containing protein 1 isoform X2 n=1 Tax=Meriones unguiculatus TaxID=10047 RepID=UPI00293F3A78|nr:ferredoxin-fold anticodon-binding domain-containing protein 1 isoform X2 [Meriones unguiculatus]